MPDYRQMYFQLAAKVANAIDILVVAQQQGEKNYSEEQPSTFSLKNAGSIKRNEKPQKMANE